MDAAPPAWVRKRDDRLEPFDADKISRALFAASESLGRPDAFLARELTDGVLHFLTEEGGGATPATSQIGELVEKVVRELGQPALAAAFAEHGIRRDRRARTAAATSADAPTASRAAGREVVLRFPTGAPLDEVLAECVRSYALQNMFARDLVAAQADGLLTLGGLEAPGDLAGCVVGAPATNPEEDGVLAALEKTRRVAGGFLALDGPEYLLSHKGQMDVRAFARELELGLRLMGLSAVVNMNCAGPPSWAGDLAEGPLFSARRLPPAAERVAPLADALAHELLRPDATGGRVRVHWHLSERDFDPGAAERLTRLAHQALSGAAVWFVFDRARRPTSLAEGVDRRHPAVLMTVGLHLPRLAEQPGVGGDQARFLKKLESLARLALSAAVQKRDFLRQRRDAGGPPVTGGFLLDRARLLAAPVGLDAVVRQLTGHGLSYGGASLDFGKRIVQTLRDVLRRDGGFTHMPTCVDGPDDHRLVAGAPDAAQVAGLTAWDADASVKAQLRAAGALHGIAEGGTAALFAPAESRPTPDGVVDRLRAAWKHSDVNRMRQLQAPAAATQQLFERGA